MDSTRKKVILNEIYFWKQNNMLPEHYCDYLIALYLKGDEDQRPQEKQRKKIDGETVFGILMIGIMSTSIFITHFTELPFMIQSVILSFFVVILICPAIYYRKKEKSPLLIYITGAFLFLLYTVEINEILYPNNVVSLYINLLLHCFMWIFIGLWRKIPFFTFAGVGAIIFILIIKQ